MIIYKAENKVNGKIYIGQTVKSLKKRIAEHLRSNVGIFPRALRKFGPQNFDFSIVETCENQKNLNEREMYWIGFLNCKSPNGYNLTDGGENPPSQLGAKRSEETIAKLKGNKNALGAIRSIETRAKMGAAKVGNKHTLGRNQTDQEKKRRANVMRGRKLSAEHREKLSKAAMARMMVYPMPWERGKKIKVALMATT
jgi:group I intron endonuclease